MLLFRLEGSAQSAVKRGSGKLGKANFMLVSLAVKDKGLGNIVCGRAHISLLLRVGQIFSGNGGNCGIVGIKDADDAGNPDILFVSYMEIHKRESFLLFGKAAAADLDLLGIADQIRFAGSDDDLFSRNFFTKIGAARPIQFGKDIIQQKNRMFACSFAADLALGQLE